METLLATVALIAGVVLCAGLALHFAARRWRPDADTLVDAIDALPHKEREALVLVRVLGYKEESEDPNEETEKETYKELLRSADRLAEQVLAVLLHHRVALSQRLRVVEVAPAGALLDPVQHRGGGRIEGLRKRR